MGAAAGSDWYHDFRFEVPGKEMMHQGYDEFEEGRRAEISVPVASAQLSLYEVQKAQVLAEKTNKTTNSRSSPQNTEAPETLRTLCLVFTIPTYPVFCRYL